MPILPAPLPPRTSFSNSAYIGHKVRYDSDEHEYAEVENIYLEPIPIQHSEDTHDPLPEKATVDSSYNELSRDCQK